MEKRAALATLRALLEARHDELMRAADAARAGARVDGVHRPATRGERGAVSGEGALAGALAQRAAEVVAALRALDALDTGPRDRGAPGALVTVEEADGAVSAWLLAPGASGEDLGDGVRALSPASPLGRALIGCGVGDEVRWEAGGRERAGEVVGVG